MAGRSAVNERADDAAAPQRAPRRRMFWLLPAATFLAGLALGAVMVWLAQPGESETETGTGEPSPEATLSPSPSPSETGGIVIPDSCLRAADAAEELVSIGREAVGALGDLDAVRLQELVADIEELDARVRDDVADCRLQSR